MNALEKNRARNIWNSSNDLIVHSREVDWMKIENNYGTVYLTLIVDTSELL